MNQQPCNNNKNTFSIQISIEAELSEQFICSSVARGKGGSSPTVGLKSMQNSTFLVLLRPIFAPHMRTVPPSKFESRSCEGLAVVWTRIVEFFGSGVHPKPVKTFFLRSPVFRRKNPLNFGEDLFFLRSPDFDRKTASICFKTNENLGQVRLQLHQTFKKAPSLCEILAARLFICNGGPS